MNGHRLKADLSIITSIRLFLRLLLGRVSMIIEERDERETRLTADKLDSRDLFPSG